jgi:hypothetical protein
LRPGMTASLICGLREVSSDLCLPLWRFQESLRSLPFATTIMSMDRAEKILQQPRQGSSLHPRPIGRDRAVLLRGRACQSYVSACLGRRTHEAFGSAARSKVYAKSAPREGLPLSWCGNRRFRSTNRTCFRTHQRVPGSSPGAPTTEKPNKIRHILHFRGSDFAVPLIRKNRSGSIFGSKLAQLEKPALMPHARLAEWPSNSGLQR